MPEADASDAQAGASDVQVALISAPDPDCAAAIARALVEERLAACVNVIPGVRSIYRYEGTLHDEAETLLIVKTRAARAPALEARVRALHPYELPEVLRLDVAGGSPAYLAWVVAETSP
jgi:periplasmic divalent cation tolerance protein